jgi:hypothetical protein
MGRSRGKRLAVISAVVKNVAVARIDRFESLDTPHRK